MPLGFFSDPVGKHRTSGNLNAALRSVRFTHFSLITKLRGAQWSSNDLKLAMREHECQISRPHPGPCEAFDGGISGDAPAHPAGRSTQADRGLSRALTRFVRTQPAPPTSAALMSQPPAALGMIELPQLPTEAALAAWFLGIAITTQWRARHHRPETARSARPPSSIPLPLDSQTHRPPPTPRNPQTPPQTNAALNPRKQSSTGSPSPTPGVHGFRARSFHRHQCRHPLRVQTLSCISISSIFSQCQRRAQRRPFPHHRLSHARRAPPRGTLHHFSPLKSLGVPPGPPQRAHGRRFSHPPAPLHPPSPPRRTDLTRAGQSRRGPPRPSPRRSPPPPEPPTPATPTTRPSPVAPPSPVPTPASTPASPPTPTKKASTLVAWKPNHARRHSPGRHWRRR